MAYQATWINRLDQLGYVNYDVIYIDDENILISQRVNKNLTIDQDTEEFKESVVEGDIIIFLTPPLQDNI